MTPCHNRPGRRCGARLRVLQELQRRDQPLLDVGEIAAERKRRQQAGLAGRFQRAGNPLRKIFAMRRRNFIVLRQFAGILGLPRQFVLKAGIRNLQHRRDHVGVGFSPEIGDAVFGDDDIAQMPRNGLVAIAPADIGLRPWRRPAGSLRA